MDNFKMIFDDASREFCDKYSTCSECPLLRLPCHHSSDIRCYSMIDIRTAINYIDSYFAMKDYKVYKEKE